MFMNKNYIALRAQRTLISSLLGFSAIGQAQSLSLSQAVHDALASAPQIKAAESQTESARWKKVETFSGHMPTVALSGTYLTNKKYMIADVSLPGVPVPIESPQVIPTSLWAANVQFPLFDGFATTARNSAADRMKASSESNLEWQKFQLERDVVLQFYRAIAASDLREVAQQNQRTLEDHLKDVRLFKKAGMSTHYDVLRVEVQASEAKSEVLNADDNLQMARVKLGELIASATEGQVPVPSGALPILTTNIASDSSAAKVTSRKDFESFQLRNDGLEKTSDAARRHYYPKISLFAQYQYYNNKTDSFSDTSSYRNAYSTGLSLNWVLFDGFASTARAHESLSEKSEAEFNLATRRHKAESDAEFWRRKLSYFLALYQSKTSEISKSEESVRLAKVGQKEGTRTSSDLLDAELELFRAKAGAIQAQMGSIEALVNLEQATGKALYKFF